MTIIKAKKETLWIAQFLATLEYRLPGQPISLKANNKRAILFTANSKFHRRTKQIKVQYHWIWEKVDSKEIVIIYISRKNMVDDGLTMALDHKLFKDVRAMIELN